MSDSSTYIPPKVWKWENQSGGKFTNINRPISGSTHEKELPIGKHPLQLYSLGTPNGIKITVLLEELLALGHEGAEYDAFLINIGEGAQFGSGFVEINPNSKIPALLDMTVKFFTLLSLSAIIKFSGSPHKPKPPDIIVIPSNTKSFKASSPSKRSAPNISSLSGRSGSSARCVPGTPPELPPLITTTYEATDIPTLMTVITE